jgi:hypothetical protein
MNASQVGIGVVGPDDVVEEEQLTAARARLIAERQARLAAVLDKHDDLVRFASSSRGHLLLCHTKSHPGSRAISYGKIRHHGRV